MSGPIVVRHRAIRSAIERGEGRLGRRGGQKIVVTSAYPDEVAIETTEWTAETAEGQRPVVVAQGAEFAVFDHRAPQDRHYHAQATELYTVLDGRMQIEVAGSVYSLEAGDTVIIPPHAVHVVSGESEFLAQVVVVNAAGAEDKYVSDGAAGNP